MPRRPPSPPATSRAAIATRPATGGRPVADVRRSVEAIEREHVGAGGGEHALATAGSAGFLPALDGAEGDVLTLVRGTDGVMRAVWRAP